MQLILPYAIILVEEPEVPFKPDYADGIPRNHYRYKKAQYQQWKAQAILAGDFESARLCDAKLKHYKDRIRAAESVHSGGALNIASEHFEKVFPNEDVPAVEVAGWSLSRLDRTPRNKHDLKGRAWLNEAYLKIGDQFDTSPNTSQLLGLMLAMDTSTPPDQVDESEVRAQRNAQNQQVNNIRNRAAQRRANPE